MAVNAQMEARKEKQEKERAVREGELAWLQEFGGKSSRYEYGQLVSNHNQCLLNRRYQVGFGAEGPSAGPSS